MFYNTFDVSIIIPYLKDRGWLDDAIKSAKGHRFNATFDVIIWKGEKLWIKNINDAMKKTNGRWIKILDEDDLLPENSISDLFEASKGFDFVCGDAENFGYVNEDWEGFEYWEGFVPTLEQMIQRNEIHGGTLLYNKRVLLEAGGFDETLWTAEEYELNLRLLSRGYKLNHVPKVVYKYRIHKTNKSMYMSANAKENRRKYIRQIAQKYVL